MKSIKSVFAKSIGAAVLACGVLTASVALADTADWTGKVVKVRADSSGYGLVYFTQDIAVGMCTHPTTRNVLAFNANTEGGKGILQVALAAHLSGKAVHIVGTGSCSIYSGIEDTTRIYLQ